MDNSISRRLQAPCDISIEENAEMIRETLSKMGMKYIELDKSHISYSKKRVIPNNNYSGSAVYDGDKYAIEVSSSRTWLGHWLSVVRVMRCGVTKMMFSFDTMSQDNLVRNGKHILKMLRAKIIYKK